MYTPRDRGEGREGGREGGREDDCGRLEGRNSWWMDANV